MERGANTAMYSRHLLFYPRVGAAQRHPVVPISLCLEQILQHSTCIYGASLWQQILSASQPPDPTRPGPAFVGEWHTKMFMIFITLRHYHQTGVVTLNNVFFCTFATFKAANKSNAECGIVKNKKGLWNFLRGFFFFFIWVELDVQECCRYQSSFVVADRMAVENVYQIALLSYCAFHAIICAVMRRHNRAVTPPALQRRRWQQQQLLCLLYSSSSPSPLLPSTTPSPSLLLLPSSIYRSVGGTRGVTLAVMSNKILNCTRVEAAFFHICTRYIRFSSFNFAPRAAPHRPLVYM